MTSLRPNERLLLVRLRRELTQQQMAADLGVTTNTYRRWELGQLGGCPKLPLGKLREHEVYRLMRMRAGLTQGALAREIGVCRIWVVHMESGRAPIQRLASYWSVR
jgi:DNA-binding XRE family transcriptional regulator